MKKFFVLSAVVLSLGACSSAEKEQTNDDSQDSTTMTDSKDAGSAEASKSEGGETTASKTSCTLDKDTRVIEVKKTEGGGCELFYNKFGEAKSVASSGFGTQYCEEVKDRIESNLKKAGFSCN